MTLFKQAALLSDVWRLVAASMLSLALCLGPVGCGTGKREMEVYGQVPDFSLPTTTVDAEGVLTRNDLLGKVWIAGFIFTHCGGPCPMLTRRMKELQDKLPAGVGFLSFTIDPARDSLDKLRQYARRFGADPRRWFFVTGEKADLYRLYEEGFNVVAAEDKALPLSERFVHTTMLVLIDGSGAIRGYYGGDQNDALFRLRRDALGLMSAAEGSPPAAGRA